MRVHETVAFALCVLLGACHSKQVAAPEDAAGDGVAGDASQARNTDVTGSLGGVPFELRYAAIKRAVDGDPRNWVCASNVPVTFVDCQQTNVGNKVLFLGPFTYDQSSRPKWDFAELAIYRTGTDALTKLASTGTIGVQTDDPGGLLQLTLSVSFGEQPLTAGYVSSSD